MKERSRTEYTVMNTAVGIGGYVLTTLMGFISRVVFTHCLSADYLGVNGLFTNILGILSLAELGVGNAVIFALYKPLAEHDEPKIASLVKFYATAYRIIGAVVAVVGLAMMPFLNIIISERPAIQESIYILYLLNLFNAASTYFFSYRSSLIIASQRNYLVSLISYGVSFVQSIVQIILLLITKNYIAFLLAQTIGTFIFNVVVYMLAGRIFPYIREKNVAPLPKEEKKSLFHNIRDLLIYKISGLLVNNTDNILITFFSGLATTGVASNYTLLVNTLNSLMNLLFNGLTASVGNHNALESDEKKYEMFRFLNMMNFWIFGWGTLGIIFCSRDIVMLFFGEKYVMSQAIPMIMSVNFFSVGMMNAVWTYKHTMGLFHYGRFIQFGTGILNIVFSVILGQQWGIFGILAATFAARLCTSLWYDPYAIFKYGFHMPVIHYVKHLCYNLTILAIAAFCCNLFMRLICGPMIVQILLKIVVCSVITNLVFVAAFVKTPEFQKLRSILATVKSIVLRKRTTASD